MTAVYIALGSNLGNSRATLLHAMDLLEPLSTTPLLKSSLWESTPVDCPPGSPSFVNAVAGLRPLPGETPESLLTKLQRLEKDFGRPAEHGINEPRTLDLDLIAFGSERRATGELTLPHPRAHLRRFVLAPLSEIAPEWILPGQRETVRDLLTALGPGEKVTRLDR